MINKEDREEKIILYVEGQLKGQDLEDFKQAMLKDDTLAYDVKIMQDVENALGDAQSVENLSSTLDTLGKEFMPDAPNAQSNTVQPKTAIIKRLPFFNNKWAIAVTVLLLFVAGGFWLNQAKTTFNSNDLFASHYEPYKIPQTTRGTNTTTDNYKLLIQYYNGGAYEKALPLAQQYIDSFPNQANLQILLGNCYLNLSPAQPQQAIEIFQPLANQKGTLLTETAQWYLALAYLKNNEQVKAKSILEELANKDIGKYPKKAQKLLLEL